jgi:hypothetical protein
MLASVSGLLPMYLYGLLFGGGLRLSIDKYRPNVSIENVGTRRFAELFEGI